MRTYRGLVPILIFAVIGTACQAGSGNGGTAPQNGGGDQTTVPVGSGGSADSLVVAELFGPERDWAIETADGFVLNRYGVSETLVRVSHEGILEPWLAESWERRDEQTWVFQLREGVQFHDGQPFNASSVVTAWDYVVNTATPPRGFGPDVLESVEAEGEHLLAVRTATPDALFPLRLANPPTGILSPSAYEAAGVPDPHGTGSGPFILTNTVRAQYFELVANENYWGEVPEIENVEVRIVSDDGVRAGMAQSGEADIVRHIPITMLPVLRAQTGITVIADPEPRTETLWFNNNHPVLGDIRVRQAISHAVDNEVIAGSVLEGAADPAIGPFPPTQPWARTSELTTYSYDPDAARALLDDAGYDEGDLTFELLTSNRLGYMTDTSVAIQKMLADVGITVQVRVMEYGALEPDVLAGNYDMFFGSRGHLLDMNDPLGFLSADYSCDGGYNLSQICDAEIDALLAEAAQNENAEERWEIYGEITEWVQENAITHFVAHTGLFTAVDDGLTNVRHHPLNHIVLTPDITW